MQIRIIKKHFKRRTSEDEVLTFGEVGEVADKVAEGLIEQGYAEAVQDAVYDPVEVEEDEDDEPEDMIDEEDEEVA